MTIATNDVRALDEASLTEADTNALHDEAAPASGETTTTADPAPEGEAPALAGEGADPSGTGSAADAERKPEDEKKPEEKPTGWKAVEAAKKEQLRLAKSRTVLEARERAAVEKEQAVGHRIEQLRGYEGQLSAREQRVAKFERAIKEGDIDALEKDFGLSYEGLTRRAVESRDPAARVERFEREQRERAAREERDAVTRAQVEEMRRDARSLIHFVDDGAEDFPNLYTWKPERIAVEGIAIRDRYLRAGRTVTYDIVLRELEKTAKAEKDHEVEKTTAREQRKSGGTSSAGSTGQAGTKGTSGSPASAPALTAKAASARPTPPRELTEEEIDEQCKAEIRAAFAKR